MVNRLLLLGALAAVMAGVGSFHVTDDLPAAGTTLAIGFVLLAAWLVGDLFAGSGLPRLTGYLVTGLVIGPGVLGLVDAPVLSRLQVVPGTAAALIALTAGLETDLREIRPLAKIIGWMLGLGVMGTIAAIAGAVLLLGDAIPFVAALEPTRALGIAFVLGVVLSAQSPAVAIALHRELGAAGPVASVVLASVIVADVAVIVMFAASSTLVQVLSGSDAAIASTIGLLVWQLLGSALIGMGTGLVLAAYANRVGEGLELFTLTAAFVVAEVGRALGLDPLLTALAMGLLIRNATSAGPALLSAVETSSLPVYVLFFAVAGASIHLDALLGNAFPVGVLVAVRAVAYVVGSRVATGVAGAPEAVKQWSGFGMLPQAGLAIALALLFSKSFPEFGAEAGALTLGVVALNELFGPVAYRYALGRAGEVGQRVASAPPVVPPDPNATPAPVPRAR